MMRTVRSALSRRWLTWWEARLPRQDRIQLTQRNLYILPTRAGWGFAAVVAVLLLASINEQVNLGYALSFLLAGAGMAALYQTHGNLQGVNLSLSSVRSVHAGDVVRLSVNLSNPHRRRGRYGLQVWIGEPALPGFADLPPGGEGHIEVDVPTVRRGWMTLPRLTIETRYPLGVFRAWAHWRPASQVLVWPTPDPHAPPLPEGLAVAEARNVQVASRQGSELPEGLRDYRRGDPLRWIAWKKSSHSLASGNGPVSREPVSSRNPDRWLDFEHSPGLEGLSPEARLSRLATWLLQAEEESSRNGRPYGLRLPGVERPCSCGSAHLRACLDDLASWDAAGAGQ